MSNSPTPMSSAAEVAGPANRHAPTAVERQRSQLDKLLKDPAKPAYVPAPVKEKAIRPPREMMKNVQGSSAGAGSGEFHVYKASRRREYERLKLLDETAQKEAEAAEFERKRKEAEEQAEAKTAKNRAKRQKKKERSKAKAESPADSGEGPQITARGGAGDVPIKKRRLVNGKELVFKRPGEDDEGGDGDDAEGVDSAQGELMEAAADAGMPHTGTQQLRVVEVPRVIIHEDD